MSAATIGQAAVEPERTPWGARVWRRWYPPIRGIAIPCMVAYPAEPIEVFGPNGYVQLPDGHRAAQDYERLRVRAAFTLPEPDFFHAASGWVGFRTSSAHDCWREEDLAAMDMPGWMQERNAVAAAEQRDVNHREWTTHRLRLTVDLLAIEAQALFVGQLPD